MKEWYCVVQGQRHGPIAEDVLRDWIRQGRVAAHDLVWTEGMPNWVPAGIAMPGAFPAGAAGGAPVGYGPAYGYAGPGLTLALPPGGTRGRTPNWQLMAQARELLAGNWGLPIGFALLAGLINIAVNMVPYVGALAGLILDGPLQLGVLVFFITFARRGPVNLGMLFIGFRSFGTALGAYLLVALIVLGWMLLFAVAGIVVMILGAVNHSEEFLILGGVLMVPGWIAGIVAQLAYSQTMFLIADDNRLGVMAAIGRSKELMRGFKWKLFCLGWRFFGWALLCLLTCGIGFLWLVPYMICSHARFYDDLLPPRDGAIAPAT
jgi:uncharacterized membrane protein